jgi:hypothetical protein
MPICGVPSSFAAHVTARSPGVWLRHAHHKALYSQRSARDILYLSRRSIVIASAERADASSFPGAHSLAVAVDKVYKFVDAQFLPVALLTALLVGYFQPARAVAAKDAGIVSVATLLIFLLNGTFLRSCKRIQRPVICPYHHT